jgi:hypothetical protein
LSRILPASKFTSLADRDDKSEAEVTEMESKGTIVLPQRNLESFLFADDVIEALLKREQKASQLQAALQIKAQALTNSTGRRNALSGAGVKGAQCPSLNDCGLGYLLSHGVRVSHWNRSTSIIAMPENKTSRRGRTPV